MAIVEEQELLPSAHRIFWRKWNKTHREGLQIDCILSSKNVWYVWWFVEPTHLKNMIKLDHYPKDWGENSKCLKSPPTFGICFSERFDPSHSGDAGLCASSSGSLATGRSHSSESPRNTWKKKTTKWTPTEIRVWLKKDVFFFQPCVFAYYSCVIWGEVCKWWMYNTAIWVDDRIKVKKTWLQINLHTRFHCGCISYHNVYVYIY